MDFPVNDPINAVISSHSRFSYGAIQVEFNVSAIPATATWPTANLGLFIPFFLPCRFVLRRMFCLNGSAVSGNIDLGVYSMDGSKIVSAGSTAHSGTSTVQIVTVTETVLAPGRYYMALSCSNTTSQFLRQSIGVLGAQNGGIVQAATQVPLANLPTFASPSNTFIPVFGISSITTF